MALDLTESSLTEPQRQARRGFLGGSDAPKILGVSPFGGPLQVWEDKMGLGERRPPGPGAHWGIILEGVVANEYARREGVKLRRPKRAVIHPEYPFIGGYLDRRIVGQPGFLEVKTGSAYGSDGWGPESSEEVPDDYYTQIEHYLGVTGLQWCDLAVLLGGQDYRRYRIARNDSFIAALIKEEVAFWNNYILTGTPPPVDGSDASREWLARRYPKDVGLIRPATPEDEALIAGLVEARAAAKRAEDAQRLAENLIKDRIGLDAGVTGAMGTVTWKTQTSRHPDWKAIAHEWRNMLAPYIPSESWATLTAAGNEAVTTYTAERESRVLRVKGQTDA